MSSATSRSARSSRARPAADAGSAPSPLIEARLSEHIERVTRGEVITVTSRGRRVAQIVPVLGRDNLERGLAEGWITHVVDRPPEPVVRQRPMPGTPTTTELISRDRQA